jgi:hypothetical protein
MRSCANVNERREAVQERVSGRPKAKKKTEFRKREDGEKQWVMWSRSRKKAGGGSPTKRGSWNCTLQVRAAGCCAAGVQCQLGPGGRQARAAAPRCAAEISFRGQIWRRCAFARSNCVDLHQMGAPVAFTVSSRNPCTHNAIALNR